MTRRTLNQLLVGSPRSLLSLHPDTADYRNRILAKGATIRQDDLLAIDRFVRSIYANSLRSLILECYPFAGDSIAAARTKLWHTESEAFTNNGFTSSNYGRTTGITGNGTASLNSNFIASASGLTNSNGSIGVYNRSNLFEAGMVVGCSDAFANNFNLIPGWSDNLNYFDCYNTTSLMGGRLRTPVNSDCRGFHVGSRVSSADSRYFQNGNQLASIMTSGGSLPTTAQHWFTYNNNGTLTAFSTKSIGFGFVGRELTSSQVSTLTTIVNRLMTDLGRSVS